MDVTDLYHGPLDDFIARRGVLAKELRASDPDAARAAAALRKPPVSVWAIDQLAAGDRDLVAELLAAGTDARDAQQAAAADPTSGDHLLRASSRLRDAVEAAVRTASAALAGAGHGSGEDTVRRLRSTLQAAATGTAADRLALWRGTLDRELAPTGFAALRDQEPDAAEVAAALAPLRRAAPPLRAARASTPASPAAELRARRAAERRLAERQTAAERARAIADAKRDQAERLSRAAQLAEDEATAAERAADEAHSAVLAAREALEPS